MIGDFDMYDALAQSLKFISLVGSAGFFFTMGAAIFCKMTGWKPVQYHVEINDQRVM